MTELTEFLNKLNASDCMVLTFNEERAYCRFFREGVYLDRMYVTDQVILDELNQLKTEGEEGDKIDGPGIAQLKHFFLAIGKGMVEQGPPLTE